MNKRKRNEIYKKALKKWSYQQQMGVLQEECAETIVAVSKILRKNGEEEENDVLPLAEEIADLKIMIEQMERLYSWYKFKLHIENYMDSKLKRLKRRLNKELEVLDE